jgi:hypothetical protein
VIPIYLARIKDTEDSNQKLLKKKRESTRHIEHLRDKLNEAERLVFSMGIPESIRKGGTSSRQERREEEAPSSDDDEDGDDAKQGRSSSSSSSSEDEHEGTESQQSADQNKKSQIDFSTSPTEPAETNKGRSAPLPAARPSFREVLVSSQEKSSQDVTMDGSTGTEVVHTLRKLITLSSLGGRKNDSVNKRTRSSATHSNEQEQPASKRPLQNGEASA